MANKLTRSKLDRFYAGIGRFVVEWADMELCLDLLVLCGRKLKSPIPHQVSAKTAFLRQVLVPRLDEANAVKVIRLVNEIDELAPIRHDYVHGAVVAHDLARLKLTVSLGRLLQPPKKPHRKTVKTTEAELLKISDRLHEIGDELLDLTDAILRKGELK